MELEEFIDSYRIATAGSYYERLDEARLFVLDASEEVAATMSEIVAYAAEIYEVNKSDLAKQ